MLTFLGVVQHSSWYRAEHVAVPFWGVVVPWGWSMWYMLVAIIVIFVTGTFDHSIAIMSKHLVCKPHHDYRSLSTIFVAKPITSYSLHKIASYPLHKMQPSMWYSVFRIREHCQYKTWRTLLSFAAGIISFTYVRLIGTLSLRNALFLFWFIAIIVTHHLNTFILYCTPFYSHFIL